MAKNIGVIICAAGSGKRFGGKKSKPLIEVAGRPSFVRSIELFADRDDVRQILMAIRAEDEEMINVKYGANLSFFGVKTYIGGSERFETVAKGLALLKDDVELVAIHDAVRCCCKPQWIDEAFEKARKTGAALLAAPVVATLKDVKEGFITKTVERAGLYEAQTPQVFTRAVITRAYEKLDSFDKSKLSDDAQLVEALGHKVAIVETDQSNIKITTQSDVAIAEAIINSRPKPKPEGYQGPFVEAQW